MTVFPAPNIQDNHYSVLERNPLFYSFCTIIVEAMNDPAKKAKSKTMCEFFIVDCKFKLLWEHSIEFSESLFSFSKKDYDSLLAIFNQNDSKFLTNEDINGVLIRKIRSYALAKSAEYISQGNYEDSGTLLIVSGKAEKLITTLFRAKFKLEGRNLLEFFSFIKSNLHNKPQEIES